jgi:prolyl 4-hydroxylase
VAAAGLAPDTIALAMIDDGHGAARAHALAAAAVLRFGPIPLQELLTDWRALEAAYRLRRYVTEAGGEPLEGSLALPHLLDPTLISTNCIVLPDARVDLLMLSHSPKLALFGKLLSAQECEGLIALGRDHVTPDEIVDGETGAGKVDPALRTSHGCALEAGLDGLVDAIDERVTRLTGRARDTREPITLSRYLPGQKFEPHTDYFYDNAAYGQHAGAQGQRIATLVIYLSEVEAGGGTVFPGAAIEVRPQRGGATYFTYQRGDGTPDPASVHGGAPVLSGEKWIATVWFRERADASERDKTAANAAIVC